ncbi:P-II family nitrogen regulator [Allofustis seminis]|uniref:P-II family nitrogen regulator n=1 Tax=Allofustis seminis TaxID=166939 RepID=UPI00036912D7|nr:P-II family nitrogen regulator [Allofustis seminis]
MQNDIPELLLLLINDEKHQKAATICKRNGLTSATYFFAHSMADIKLWQMLGLDDMHRECTLIIGPSHRTKSALHQVAEALHLDKKNNGLGLRISLKDVLGIREENDIDSANLSILTEKGQHKMYNIVITIVDRGKADLVLDASKRAGGNGGTIIHGRGSAAKSKKVFNMEIEPEKEIVAIIIENDKTDNIVATIAEELKIEKENTGVLFTFPLEEVRGVV